MASLPPSSSPAVSPAPVLSRALHAIFWGGLLAGIWDLGFAFVYYGLRGATAVGVMQSVAAGLIGKPAAFAGGSATAALGVACHFLIAFGAAATYFAASRRWPTLVKRALPAGLAFGGAVYFFMNLVVLPLSALHTRVFPPSLLAPWPILAHLVGVGLPIALATRRFSR